MTPNIQADALTTVMYFGRRWDSPYLDAAPDRNLVHCPVPAGEQCLWCDESITGDDSGLFMPMAREGDIVSVEPIHVECHLRMMMGSPAHLRGECRCSGEEEPAFPGTRHEEALETLKAVNHMRASNGMKPIL